MGSAGPSVAVAFGILLAGCVAATPTATPPGSTQEITFSEGLGAIKGLVVDDSLSPIPNALVGIQDGPQMITDPSGAFVFSSLEPKRYTLLATAHAFQQSAVQVEVVADEVANAQVVLVPLPSSVTFYETFPQSGFMACGVGGTIPAAGGWTFAACGPFAILGLYDVDRFMLDWPEATPLGDDVAGYFGETQWLSSQALTGELNVIWWIANGPYLTVAQNAATWSADNLGDSTGRTPLNTRITRETIEGQADGICELPDACYILSGHYPSSKNFGTPLDQTVVFQQRYEDMFTVFHGAELPENFTALQDV